LRIDPPGVSFSNCCEEVIVNVQAFQELKRVLRAVPKSDFNIGDWSRCACGHATRDSWFRERGFTRCQNFYQAAAFLRIPLWKAEDLFSAQYRRVVTPADFIERIDAMLADETEIDARAARERREAIIDDLLAKATNAARKAMTVGAALVAVLF
jgi:hypothetical protein